MKKQLLCMCALVLLACFGLGTAHASVSSTANQVQLTEHLIAGDRTALENLCVQTRSQEARQLFWDTTLRSGSTVENTFRFSPKPTLSSQSGNPGLQLDSDFVVPLHGSKYFSMIGSHSFPSALKSVVQDLTQKTEAGMTEGFPIRVSDYTDFYPLDFQLTIPGLVWNANSKNYHNEDFWAQMQETFRFPVPPEHRLTAGLRVNHSGTPAELVFASIEGQSVQLQALSQVSSSGVWFIPNVRRETDNTLLDYSHTPGYGVYYLDCTDGVLSIDRLERVLPLKADQEILRMETSPDKTILYLVVRGSHGHDLHILSAQHPEIQQHFHLTDATQELPWAMVSENDLVVQIFENQIHLYTADANGVFAPCFSASLPDAQQFFAYMPRAAFDGQRLALVSRIPHELCQEITDRSCANGFVLVVCEAGKRTYAGLWENSMDAASTRYGVGPLDENGLSLAWD